MANKKLAIITTHPIQYYAPVFKMLQDRNKIDLKVFYTWGEAAMDKHDPGFGKSITWDLPLLEGYPYQWVKNTSASPGSHNFRGIVTPHLIDNVNAFKPDAVLVIGWAYKSHLKAIRYYKNKIPVFFRGDSTLLDETGGLKSLLKSLFLKWLYNHVDIAFYNGTNNKAYFEKYGIPRKHMVFAPHAVDNKRFALPSVEEAIALRQRLRLTATDTLVLFAGKLEEKKDPELLLNAFIALNKPGVHLLFTGNGILEESLKLKAKQYTNVHFIDFQNQGYMPIVYQACDLFCLPSKGPAESWGLAVNEAMAAGKAILVSDKCGCAADLVQNDKNGAIFKSGSVDDLLSCLKKFTSDKNKLTNLGAASRSIIKPWNFLNIAQAIENICKNETN